MGCNCGKNRRQRQPLGKGNAQERTAAKAPADNTQRGIRQRSRANGETQSFTLQGRDGRTQTFGSRLEAEAARVRAGGGQIR